MNFDIRSITPVYQFIIISVTEAFSSLFVCSAYVIELI